jgi:hypothetical protein
MKLALETTANGQMKTDNALPSRDRQGAVLRISAIVREICKLYKEEVTQ